MAAARAASLAKAAAALRGEPHAPAVADAAHADVGGEETAPEQLSAEVFSVYRCLTITDRGVEHPGEIAEAASLCAIRLPDTSYPLWDALPANLVSAGRLSRLQLEGVLYACAKHTELLPDGTRFGFFIGDGAGVGKGRQVAGIVLDNVARGRKKHVWVSTSTDLLNDAQRDIRDLGMLGVRVIDGPQELDKSRATPTEGVLFTTYSTLTSGSKKRTRLQQIIDWVSGGTPEGAAAFDGVIVFDEAHKAKNFAVGKEGASTKVATNVIALQAALPSARIVYCSATGVSEVGNMAYMSRLGFWGTGTPFESCDSFMSSLSKRGLGFLELLAMEMKSNGVYVSRALSFTGCEFENAVCDLTAEQEGMYNDAVAFWTQLRADVQTALQLTNCTSGDVWKIYWGAAQRFFKLLCVSLKLPRVVAEVKAALATGQCAVVGLQSTGEAATTALDLQPGAATPFISVVRELLIRFVREQFPTRIYGPAEGAAAAASAALAEATEAGKAKKLSPEQLSVLPECPDCLELRERLLEAIEALNLPNNPVDELVELLGGETTVAEMTGRRGRIVSRPWGSGRTTFQLRAQPDSHAMDSLNVEECKTFQAGKKLVAIISAAASTGISLHSDARAGNTRRRVHLTIELPWAADSAIQQLGRTHRSNEVTPPIYKLVVTPCGGEKRFAAAVARRLQSLGALTRGDRRAASGLDLSESNLDSPLGRKALRRMYDALASADDATPALPAGVAAADLALGRGASAGAASSQGASPDLAGAPLDAADILRRLRPCAAVLGIATVGSSAEATAEAAQDAEAAGDKAASAANMSDVRRFLNRLLVMPIDGQEACFSLFAATLAAEVRTAKAEGRYTEGLSEIGGRDVQAEGPPMVLHRQVGSTLPTYVTTLRLDRGVSFDAALELLESKGMVILAIRRPGQKYMYGITRPNTGVSFFDFDREELQAKYTRVANAEDARATWDALFDSSLESCMHGDNCAMGAACQTGRRLTSFTVVHGSIVNVWNHLEETLKRHEHTLSKSDKAMRAVRVELAGGARLVGVRFPRHLLGEVSSRISAAADADVAAAATKAAAGGPLVPYVYVITV